MLFRSVRRALTPRVNQKRSPNAPVCLHNNPPENGFVAGKSAFACNHLCIKSPYRAQIASFLLESPVFSPILCRVWALWRTTIFFASIMDDPHVPSSHLAADRTSPCKTAKPQIYRFFIYAKSYDDGMFSCKPFFIPNFATLPRFCEFGMPIKDVKNDTSIDDPNHSSSPSLSSFIHSSVERSL